MSVHFSSEQLTNAIKALRGLPDGVVRAAVPAMNRASLAGRTFGVRKLADTYVSRRGDVTRTVRDVRATRTSLVAGFTSRGVRIPLASFSVRPASPTTRREKFSVSVRRGEKTSVARGFVAAVRGGLAVLQRVGRGRSPVRGAYGPAVPQMFSEPGVRGEVEGRAMSVLAARFEHEVGRLLGGMR